MSSRLPTSRSRRSVIVDDPAARPDGGREQSTSEASRLLTLALIEESGVRRSWETARSSAVRSRSASASQGGRVLDRPAQLARSMPAPSWRANAEQRRSSAAQRPAAEREDQALAGRQPPSAASGSSGASRAARAATTRASPSCS